MNSYIEPNCSVRQQRQEQEGEEEERKRFSHVYNKPTVLPTPFFTELTWENGHPARRAISGLVAPIPERPTHAHDTLEFAVRQATHCKQKPSIGNYYHDLENLGYHRQPSSSLCQSAENSYNGPMDPSSTEDPMKPEPSPRQAQGSDDDAFQEHVNNMGTMPFRETDTTFVTWPPFNSPILPTSHVTKWAEKSRGDPMGSNHLKRPTKLRPSSQQRQCSEDVCEEGRKRTATTSFEENDPSFSTWPWFEATASIKSKTMDDDSTSHGGLVKQVQKKMDSGGSHSTRRSRTAVGHNQSERRRRDRINEKMRALQKLVPGTSKADKASILDEVIKHLKQLQAQLMMMMMMMSRRSAPPLMIPPGVLQQQQQLQQVQQQQLYMSLMARFGMGMGVLDMSSIRPPPSPPPPILNPIFRSTALGSFPFTTTPPFVPPDQMVMPTHTTSPLEKPSPTPISPPQPDPFSAFHTQSMNIDFFNKMAILYKHQESKSMRVNIPSHEKHEQKK